MTPALPAACGGPSMRRLLLAGVSLLAAPLAAQTITAPADGAYQSNPTGQVAGGSNASSSAVGAIALGRNAIANVASSVALGDGAATAAPNTTAGNAALGIDSNAGTAFSTVSVGAAGAERQIQRVAAGSVGAASTDAVNGSQLFAVQTNVVQLGTSVATALGGGSSYTVATGVLTAPSYTILGTSVPSVGEAFTLVNNSLRYLRVNSTGTAASASATNAIAIGQNARAETSSAIAMGTNAQARNGAAVAIGNNARAISSTGSIAFGVAIGQNANATSTAPGGSSPIAIGIESKANGAGSQTAIGDQAVATGLDAIAIGGKAFSPGVQATGDRSTAIGQAALAAATGAVAIGNDTAVRTGSTGAIAFGNAAIVDTNAAAGTAFGTNTRIGTGSVNAAAIGGNARVGTGSVDAAAIGGGARIGSNALRSLAFGSGAVVADGAADGLALGTGALVRVSGGAAIGLGSDTGTEAPSLPGFLTNQAASPAFISFGSESLKRRLSNLADGAEADDAVTVAQLTVENTGRNALGAATAALLGAGAAYDPLTGAIAPPAYLIQGGSFGDVGSALAALDTATTANGTAITTVAGDLSTLAGDVNNGAIGPVRYADAGAPTVPNGGVPSQNLALVGATAAPVTLSNVAPGAVTATSLDAVNGSQLFALGTVVSQTGAGIVNILGGGAAYDPLTGTVTPPAYAVQGGSFGDVGSALAALDGATTANTTAIAGNTADIQNLQQGVGNGTIGLVQQTGGAPGSGPITVGAATGGTSINVAGTEGNRTISGVADGQLPTDAVNRSQLDAATANAVRYTDATQTAVQLGTPAGAPVSVSNLAAGSLAPGSTDAVNGGQVNTALGSVASVLGAGAGFDPVTGQITPPAFAVQGQTYGTVGDALGALDTRTSANSAAILALEQGVANGGLGPVRYADAATPTTPNGGTPSQNLTLVGAADGPVTLDNVAPGTVAPGSSQAVNGSQLAATNQAVAGTAAALGGGASVDPVTGQVTAPTYQVAGGSFENVGDAVSALDRGVADATQAAAGATAVATTADNRARIAQTAADIALGAASAASGVAGEALAASRNAVQYDEGRQSVTLNPGAAAAVLRNVAPGTAATDAVNLGQLNAAQSSTLAAANAYTDRALEAVTFDLARLDRRVNAAAANTNALAGLPQVITPGLGMVAVAVGGRGDAVAVAFGASKSFGDEGRTIVRAGASFDNKTRQVGYNVGLGYQF